MIAIAIGLSVATALGRPEVGSGDNEIRDIVVVIDNSATMATRRSDGYTRWEHAVAEARELLQQGSAAGRFLIVDTAGQAPPTEASDRGSALDVLEGLSVSLGGESQFPTLAASDGELYFVSDGVMVDDVPAEYAGDPGRQVRTPRPAGPSRHLRRSAHSRRRGHGRPFAL